MLLPSVKVSFYFLRRLLYLKSLHAIVPNKTAEQKNDDTQHNLYGEIFIDKSPSTATLKTSMPLTPPPPYSHAPTNTHGDTLAPVRPTRLHQQTSLHQKPA